MSLSNTFQITGKCSAIWNCAGRPKSAEIIHSIIDRLLKILCVTRWNSLFDSLAVLISIKHKVNELTKKLNLPLFKEAELDYLIEYTTVMKPIAMGLDRLQAEKDSYFGIVMPTLLVLEKKIIRMNLEAFRHCSPLIKAVLDGFKKRFSYI